MEEKDIVILGIDPGYERLGLAIIKKSPKEKEFLVFSECFKTEKTTEHSKRLSLVRDELVRVIKEHKPEEASVETLFFTNNKKTATSVAEVRGVILETLSSLGVSAKEYSPTTIKLTVTGDGRAKKDNIMKMVPLIIKGAEKIKSDDEMDAVAVGLTHLSLRKTIIHNK